MKPAGGARGKRIFGKDRCAAAIWAFAISTIRGAAALRAESLPLYEKAARRR
jgi:hypothetical protein